MSSVFGIITSFGLSTDLHFLRCIWECVLSCGPAGKWNAYESVRLPQPPSYLTFFGAFAMQNLIYNRKWAWIPANLPVEVCSKRKSQGCGLQSMCGYPLFRLLALTDSSVPKKKINNEVLTQFGVAFCAARHHHLCGVGGAKSTNFTYKNGRLPKLRQLPGIHGGTS